MRRCFATDSRAFAGVGVVRRFRFGLIAFLAAAVLTACQSNDDELLTIQLFVMATSVDLTLPRETLDREPGLISAIESELRQIERDFYAWGDGELAALNRTLTDGQSFEASSQLTDLLSRSDSISTLTDGAFDPGVGTLVELWGFHDSEQTGSEPPGDDEIAAMLELSGSISTLRISTDDNEVVPIVDFVADGSRPVERIYTLDLGGIAKGAAVDRVIDLLKEKGVQRALVNAGGDLAVIGEPLDRSWRIGVQAPRDDGMLGAIELRDGEAAFTSGDYERFFDHDGERLHHILDPRTGVPVDHTQALTVVATDATLADAAATALFVAGPDEWRGMAQSLGIDAVLRVDAAGRVEMTDAMRDRFQPGP